MREVKGVLSRRGLGLSRRMKRRPFLPVPSSGFFVCFRAVQPQKAPFSPLRKAAFRHFAAPARARMRGGLGCNHFTHAGSFLFLRLTSPLLRGDAQHRTRSPFGERERLKMESGFRASRGLGMTGASSRTFREDHKPSQREGDKMGDKEGDKVGDNSTPIRRKIVFRQKNQRSGIPPPKRIGGGNR